MKAKEIDHSRLDIHHFVNGFAICCFSIMLAALPLEPACADTVEVRIEKMRFVPEVVRVKAGDTVVWKSYEKRGYHTVWFQNEGVAESELMFPGESWQRKFDTKGEYPYICGPHPHMVGRVIVE
ncbi:MAG: cupredoxin domain-containing protein [Nitrosomonadales bacterium]|nr:cupredoxin domain-containing protein [Nitrosomonadales bacterium]